MTADSLTNAMRGAAGTMSVIPPGLAIANDPPADCTVWCIEGHNHAEHKADPACWGYANETALTMEEGYDHKIRPDQALRLDPPRVGVYAYRQEPLHREVVYLHIYRTSDNDFLNLDASVNLTAAEAISVAKHLLAVAELIEDGA